MLLNSSTASTEPSKVVIWEILSILIFSELILSSFAFNNELLKIIKNKNKKKKNNYFSLIWITPIEQNKLTAIKGIQTASVKEILFVWPKAIDKSLK